MAHKVQNDTKTGISIPNSLTLLKLPRVLKYPFETALTINYIDITSTYLTHLPCTQYYTIIISVTEYVYCIICLNLPNTFLLLFNIRC